MQAVRRTVTLSVSLLVLPGCASPPARGAPAPVELRLATGPIGGGFYPFGEALAEALDKVSGSARLEVRATTGAVANIQAIQRGTADVAFAFADVAYLAFVGRLEPEAGAFDRLRGIAVLQLTPVQLIARAGSGIRSVSDLRDRFVSVGPDGSGTALTAHLIFEAFGLSPASLHVKALPFADASAQLLAGTVDAMFDNAMHPTASAALALGAGAHLVPIDGSHVRRLTREYPFLKMTVLPRDTYPGTETIPTVGVNSLLVCSRLLGEEIVHELTARLFQALPLLSTSRRLGLAELDEASTTPIPLHDGAARYYREQELLR